MTHVHTTAIHPLHFVIYFSTSFLKKSRELIEVFVFVLLTHIKNGTNTINVSQVFYGFTIFFCVFMKIYRKQYSTVKNYFQSEYI